MTRLLKFASLLPALALGAASVAHADLADIKKRGELRVAGAGAGDSHNIDAGLGSLRARGRRVV